MPPASKRSTTGRRPAVKVTSPDPDDRLFPFELGGETYHAWMPKDYVFMQLAAAFAADADGDPADMIHAIPMFMKCCLPPEQRRAINARMLKRPSEDAATAMEMYLRLGQLVKEWTPIMEKDMRETAKRLNAAEARG